MSPKPKPPKLNLAITLAAAPDPTYSPESHRGNVKIEPREVRVPTLAKAVEHYGVFVVDHNLGAGNLSGAGMVTRDGVPVCRISHDGKVLEVGPDGLATGRLYRDPGSHPRKFRHLGELLRALREDAGLLRKDLAGAVGIAVETVRNIEMQRHAANAWTWSRLIGHPALQDFARIAAESGLELPKGVVGPGVGGTASPVRGAGEGGGDGEEGEAGDRGGAPDRGTR